MPVRAPRPNYVNGVQVSAATAASLLGMGAAAIVPIGFAKLRPVLMVKFRSGKRDTI